MTEASAAGLGAAVFFAGVVDALAGGGGLVTLPAYMAAGLDPSLILGTNKLASAIGTTVSAVRYQRSVRVPLGRFALVIAACAAAAWLGARLASRLDPDWIRPLLLCALPPVAWTVWSRRDFGALDRGGHLSADHRRGRELAAAVPVGLYDGFFGPGAGTFYALGLVRIAHYDLVGATARAKLLNLTSNVFALAAFAWAGAVDWRLGLPLGAASVAGHWVGSSLGVRRGSLIIRPVVALVCAGLFAKILLDAAR